MSKEQSAKDVIKGQPVISHFAQPQAYNPQSQSAPNTGDQNKDQTRSATASPKLQELYPVPKTPEQLNQDILALQESRVKKRPKHPILTSALFASIIFYVALLLFRNLEILWFSGGIVGVSISFGVMIWLLAATNFCIIHIRNIFYAYGGPVVFFTTTYAVIGFLLFGGILAGWFGDIGGSRQLLLAATIHFLVMSFALRLSLGKGI